MNSEARILIRSIADPVEREDAIYKYEERAAICEFDGLLSREAAEAMALKELRNFLKRSER